MDSLCSSQAGDIVAQGLALSRCDENRGSQGEQGPEWVREGLGGYPEGRGWPTTARPEEEQTPCQDRQRVRVGWGVEDGAAGRGNARAGPEQASGRLSCGRKGCRRAPGARGHLRVELDHGADRGSKIQNLLMYTYRLL